MERLLIGLNGMAFLADLHWSRAHSAVGHLKAAKYSIDIADRIDGK